MTDRVASAASPKGRASVAMSTVRLGPLNLDDDLLVACVSCGLCLPHCPTYRATGEELLSPRGRIAAMRAVDERTVAIDDTVRSAFDTCVMCRGCETACPSGVKFGQLMETTRAAMTLTAPPPRLLRLGLGALRFHRTLLFASSVLGVGQRLRLIPRSVSWRFGAPSQVPIRRPPLLGLVNAHTADAYLFTGCVMDAWQRDVHVDALALMQATGACVAIPEGGGCCGALHVHSGLTDQAQALAHQVMSACPGEAPIVVDSAGCGAALQDYGHLLGTPAAHQFSKRVVDVSSWLADRIELLIQHQSTPGTRETVVIQDPCHLRHVQRAQAPVRVLLSPFVDVIELPDDGRCCGAGGAFSVLQPELATSIRDAKLEVIRKAAPTGNTIVASGNPGCSMWLAQAGIHTEHPVSIVARHVLGRS